MQKKTRLVHGIGVNDADYAVSPTINGKQVMCPFYQTWTNMLARCYDPKIQARQPTYVGCEVAPEWLNFMTFRAWMAGQDWRGMHIDKDLLIPGNRVYSPGACAFISRGLNNFATDHAAARGEWPIGVNWHKQIGKFAANCRNPFTGRLEHLGLFICPNEAHEAWRAKKHGHALALAAEQTDPRLAAALSTRYLEKQ
jgi:hypothetical protein